MTAEAQRRYRERHPDRIAAFDRAYARSEKGREVRRRSNREWKAANRDVVREHNRILQRVRYHVAVGHLAKTACKGCGSETVQAHHHLGYAPEHELDVVLLCSRCHHEAHVAMERGATRAHARAVAA